MIKPSAATPSLMKHRGRAVVFESIEDYHERVDDPSLDIDESCVMVLKYCGPKGYPGFAEVGNMALPQKLLKKGVTDMVRISDARMSGTLMARWYCTPHRRRPPVARSRWCSNGDIIELDVARRRLHLEVSDAELEKRRKEWKAPPPHDVRGYVKLYCDHVNQADQGCDLDFLVGRAAPRWRGSRTSHSWQEAWRVRCHFTLSPRGRGRGEGCESKGAKARRCSRAVQYLTLTRRGRSFSNLPGTAAVGSRAGGNPGTSGPAPARRLRGDDRPTG